MTTLPKSEMASRIHFLEKNDVFPKGKYKGKTVAEIIKKDPKYIIREFENFKSFSFSDNILDSAYEEVISLSNDFDDEVFYV